jgi:serine-type D-Ala-D-Ala carboxypeptidase/endopeptidase
MNRRTKRALFAMAALALTLLAQSVQARAEDTLLEETVEFAGTFIFLEAKAPAAIIGVVKDGEMVVRGFGEISDGSGKEPDGNTLMRIGSITKVFAGAALASMVADGKVKFTDRLQDRLGWDVKIPTKDGKEIRLIDLATHASGLPREAPVGTGDRTSTRSKEDYVASLTPDILLFPPGTGVLYSNFGFDLLAQALANGDGKPYQDLLKARVLSPAGLTDTVFTLRDGDEARAMQGHNFDGSPMPFIPTSPLIQGAGGLYSTTNDLLRWLQWHLDRFSTENAEMRFLDHAIYLQRDGLKPASGLDEAGTMDAMGLGWVMMKPEGNRPLILQKTGGLQGMFSYIAFSPGRNIGAFAAINKFDVGGFDFLVKSVNGLIEELTPR